MCPLPLDHMLSTKHSNKRSYSKGTDMSMHAALLPRGRLALPLLIAISVIVGLLVDRLMLKITDHERLEALQKRTLEVASNLDGNHARRVRRSRHAAGPQ